MPTESEVSSLVATSELELKKRFGISPTHLHSTQNVLEQGILTSPVFPFIYSEIFYLWAYFSIFLPFIIQRWFDLFQT